MKNISTTKEIFYFLKPFLWSKLSKKFKFFFLACFLFLILAKIATLITPIILGKTIDSLNSISENMEKSFQIILGLILSYGLAKILSLAFNEIKDLSLFFCISISN